MSNKKAKAQTSIEMTASANRLFALGGLRASTDTDNARLNELNARLNALNESIEELAIELLDNTTDKPLSYYNGSLKKLNAQEAQELKAEIEAELGE